MVQCKNCGYSQLRSPEEQKREEHTSRCENQKCKEKIDNVQSRGIIERSATVALLRKEDGSLVSPRTPIELASFMRPSGGPFSSDNFYAGSDDGEEAPPASVNVNDKVSSAKASEPAPNVNDKVSRAKASEPAPTKE